MGLILLLVGTEFVKGPRFEALCYCSISPWGGLWKLSLDGQFCTQCVVSKLALHFIGRKL